MALNASGPISLGGATVGQSVNLELGNADTATASINSAPFRGLAGVASGAISLSNFYGKSSGTFFFAAIYNATGGSTISIDASDNYYFSAAGPGQYPAALKTNSVGTVAWQKFSNGVSTYISGGYVQTLDQVWLMRNGYQAALNATTGNSTGNIRNINTHSNVAEMPVGLTNSTVAFPDNESFSGCCGSSVFYGVGYLSSGLATLRKNVWRDCDGTQGKSETIVVDSSNNIYTAGFQYYPAAGQYRGMIVKMDSNLGVTWARLYGYTSGSAAVRAIGINSSGDLAINFTRSGTSLNFVKYNNSGTFQWANSLTGVANAFGMGAALDSSGNLYFVSRWRNATTGNDDTIIVKYNLAGTIQWQRLLSCVVNGNTANLSIQPSNQNCLKIDSTGALVMALQYFTGPQGARGFLAKLPNDGSKTGTYTLTDSNANSVVITYAVSTATNAAASGYVQGSTTWPSTAANTSTANFGSNSVLNWTSGYTLLII